MKNTLGFIIAVTFISCSSSTITVGKYVEVMGALGCKNLQEDNSAADEVLKQNGVTHEQLQTFRQKTDFKVIAGAAGEIAKRVYACHGVNQ